MPNPCVKKDDQRMDAPKSKDSSATSKNASLSSLDLKQGDKQADVPSSKIDTATSRNDTLKTSNLKQDDKPRSGSSSKIIYAKVEETHYKTQVFSGGEEQVSSEVSVSHAPQPQLLLVNPGESTQHDGTIVNDEEPRELTQVQDEYGEKAEETADEAEVPTGEKIEEENNENIPEIPLDLISLLVQDHPLPDSPLMDGFEDLVNESRELSAETASIQSDPRSRISARLAGPKEPPVPIEIDDLKDSMAVEVLEGSESSSSFLAKGWSFLKKAAFIISVLGAIGSVPIGIFYCQYSNRSLP